MMMITFIIIIIITIIIITIIIITIIITMMMTTLSCLPLDGFLRRCCFGCEGSEENQKLHQWNCFPCGSLSFWGLLVVSLYCLVCDWCCFWDCFLRQILGLFLDPTFHRLVKPDQLRKSGELRSADAGKPWRQDHVGFPQ